MIDLSRRLRVGQNSAHPTQGAVGGGNKAEQPAVPDRKQIARIRRAVNDPVVSDAEVAHIHFGKGAVLHHAEIAVGVDAGDPAGGGNINRAVLILRNGAGMGGGHAVQLAPSAQLALRQHGHAVVVGADPQPVPAVHVEAFDAGEAAGGIHALKGVAVVADQTGVAADPEKALVGFRDGVGLRGGQAVAVIVQHGGKPFAAPGGVHRKGAVHDAAGVVADHVGFRKAYG